MYRQALLVLHKTGHPLTAHIHGGSLSLDLPITILLTTVCWVIVAFAAPQTDERAANQLL